MAKCPKCRKELKIDDYDTRYDYELEDCLLFLWL